MHRDFRGQIKSATVSQVPSGKYYVSILVETEHKELPHTKQNIGLDLGIKDLCITSDERKYENPKTIQKYERKLARLQKMCIRDSRISYRVRRKALGTLG